MFKVITLIAVILAVMGGHRCQDGPTRVECPFNTMQPYTENCFKYIPFCKVFEYRPDPAHADRWIYRCVECAEGFKPFREVDNLMKAEFGDLPKTQNKYLPVCDLDPSFTGFLPVNTDLTIHKLPNCLRYKTSNHRTADDGSVEADFTCVECDYNFQPFVNHIYQFGSLHSNTVLGVCTRKVETRDCGFLCQSEFPGCKKIQIKDVIRSSNLGENYYESALFKCIEAEDSFEIILRGVRANTDTFPPKVVTIPPQTSGEINCIDDWECQAVLPNCEKYYTQSNDLDSVIFFCLKCRQGYEPQTYGVWSQYELKTLFSQRQELTLCKPIEVSKMTLTGSWKAEVPGCEVLTVSSPQLSLTNAWVAKYECNQCAPGFVKVEDSSFTLVSGGFELIKKVKIRCRPEEVTIPKDCDSECQKRFPNCRKYTSIFNPNIPLNAETFRCTECEDGFEPTHDPDVEPWYLGEQKVVCKRIPTPGPVDCPEICKAQFPNCDKISISKDERGHNVYQCDQCEKGYYPIAYEEKVRGRMSVRAGDVHKFNTIYLCTSQEDLIPLKIFDCNPTESQYYRADQCNEDTSCATIGIHTLFYSIVYRATCLKCKPGYSPKSTPVDNYDLDLNRCEPTKPSSKSAPIWQ